MERHIVHLDLDTFFVSVERLQNSKLIGMPVLIGGSSDRGVVASCSYEARAFGVHSAMPMRLARQLCPHAVIVRGDHDMYSKYSKMVTEIISEKAPVVEKASIDEHYLDLSGMDKYFGCFKWTSELRQRIIKETGLPISFGLSTNKTVSKIATGEAKPNGSLNIVKGVERGFLAPLPSKKIPMIGDKTWLTLKQLGLQRIGTIQEMPIELMHKTFGENGVSIWNKANGIDTNPVVPHHEQKSMSTEQTFEKDTIDMELLRSVLMTMTTNLGFDLRKQGRLTGCVTVKIRYANFDTHPMQSKIPYTCSDEKLVTKVMELFKKLYTRRMLIRLVGVKFSDLVTGGHQIDLFSDPVKDVNLMRALDSIKNRFGIDAVMRATSLGYAS